MKRWTKEETKRLRDMVGQGLTDEEIGERLNRTMWAVRGKRLEERILRREGMSYWTEEEDEFLKRNYKTMSDSEIGEALNRTCNSVRSRRVQHLDITRTDTKPADMWTNEEDLMLSRMFWEGATDEELSRELGRSVKAVSNRRQALGLLKAYVKANKVYIYYRRGEYIATGTIDEIAEETGIKQRSLEQYKYSNGPTRVEEV